MDYKQPNNFDSRTAAVISSRDYVLTIPSPPLWDRIRTHKTGGMAPQISQFTLPSVNLNSHHLSIMLGTRVIHFRTGVKYCSWPDN